jgi:uncharacterized protein YbjT (DUF2867 family)
MTTVAVFGGTGFLGRQVVRRRAANGATVRVAVRNPEQARSGLRAADLERVTVFRADVRNQMPSRPLSLVRTQLSTPSPLTWTKVA